MELKEIEQQFDQVILGNVDVADIRLMEFAGLVGQAQLSENETMIEKALVATFMLLEAKKQHFIEQLKSQG